jgi:hypothetical protein
MPDVFVMPPAPARSMWVVLIAIALVVLPMLLLGYVMKSGRTTRYQVTESGLTIRGTLYGRTIPWDALAVADARHVNLSTERPLQPTLRTNGIGLPGYQAGWFRLRQSGKGLLFVTDRSRVVAIPTTLGYTLLLSVNDPLAFLDAAQQRSSQ